MSSKYQKILNLGNFASLQDLVKVLSEDNLAFEIPSYLRKNLELDLQAMPEKAPQGLLLQVMLFFFKITLLLSAPHVVILVAFRFSRGG